LELEGNTISVFNNVFPSESFGLYCDPKELWR
jgi:hypothetical protein